nr:putative reverse transcriptase domain-containing protein [Tanacetum cinerariifolium]
MLRACAIDFGGNWDTHLPLVEFSNNNGYHSSVKCAPFNALYGRRCQTPIAWEEIETLVLMDSAIRRLAPPHSPHKGCDRYGSKGSGHALSILKMKAARYLDFGLELLVAEHMWINETRNLVIRQRVEDFQLSIESYQKQLNLTKLGWDAKGFKYKHDYTIINSPRAVVFPVGNNERKIMRFNKIYEFSDVYVGNPNAYDWLKCVAHDPRDEIDGYEVDWIEGTRLKELDALEALDSSSACYKKESSSYAQGI